MFLLALPVITISVALWPLRSKLLPSMESQTLGPEDLTSPSYFRSRRRLNTLPETSHEPVSDKQRISGALIDGSRSYGVPMSRLSIACMCLQALAATTVFFWIVIARNINGFKAAVGVLPPVYHHLHACWMAYAAVVENAYRYPTVFLSGMRGTEDFFDATNITDPALSRAKATRFLMRTDCVMPFAISITTTMIWPAITQSMRGKNLGFIWTLFICIMPVFIVSLDYWLGRYSRRLFYAWYVSLRSRQV